MIETESIRFKFAIARGRIRCGNCKTPATTASTDWKYNEPANEILCATCFADVQAIVQIVCPYCGGML